MKKGEILSLLMLMALVSMGGFAQQYPELELGSKAPHTDLELSDISGKTITLNGIAGGNGLLVVFTSNGCPWVGMWENRYNDLAAMAEKNKVGFVLVNSNCKNRGDVDSFDEMKKHAKEAGYKNLYYVIDKKSKLANATGAKTTPHVFLYDKNLTLVYKGTIDDNPKDKNAVKEAYVKDALNQLGAGKKVSVKSNEGKGCGIKRHIE